MLFTAITTGIAASKALKGMSKKPDNKKAGFFKSFSNGLLGTNEVQKPANIKKQKDETFQNILLVGGCVLATYLIIKSIK